MSKFWRIITMKKLTLLLVLCLAGSALSWCPQRDDLSGYASTRCQQSKKCTTKELDAAYNAWYLRCSVKNKKALESCIANVLSDDFATTDEKAKARKYKKVMDSVYTKKTIAKPSASRTPTQTNTEARVCTATSRRSIYPIIPVGLYESSGYFMPSAPKSPEKELSAAEKKAKAKEAKKAEWKAKREKFHKSHSPKLVSNPWPF